MAGCRRPYWSRECQADNKQLHNIAQSFAHMRDAILATAAAADAADSGHQPAAMDRAWPNQRDARHDDTSDADSSSVNQPTTNSSTEGAHAHTQRQTQGQARGQPRKGRGAGRHSGRQAAEVGADEQRDSASKAAQDDRINGSGLAENELAAGLDDELIGDSEVRLRMRSRRRPATRQQQQLTAHSNNNNHINHSQVRTPPMHDNGGIEAHSGCEESCQQQQTSASCHDSVVDTARLADTAPDGGGSAAASTDSSSSSSTFSSCSVLHAARSPDSASPPPSLAAPSSCGRVIVLSSASRAVSRAAQQAVEQLGGATVVPSTESDWFSHTSHVVCCQTSTSRLVKRTMKYMVGVLSGCWVVDWQWITDSAAAGRWLTEENYEINGDSIAGATHAARRAREERDRSERELTRDAPQQPLSDRNTRSPLTSRPSRCSLLSGCYVCVLEPLSPQCPTLHDLTLLIRLAGGQLILPPLSISNTSSRVTAASERAVTAVANWVEAVQRQLPSVPFPSGCSVIVLCRPSLLEAVESGECSSLSALHPLTRIAGLQLLSISWLLDSIGAFARLPLDSSATSNGSHGHSSDNSGSRYSLTHLVWHGTSAT